MQQLEVLLYLDFYMSVSLGHWLGAAYHEHLQQSQPDAWFSSEKSEDQLHIHKRTGIQSAHLPYPRGSPVLSGTLTSRRTSSGLRQFRIEKLALC